MSNTVDDEMKIDNKQDVPLIMHIPAPILVRRPRGLKAAALNSKMDTRFKILLDTQEKELICEEAQQLGVTTAEFIRHCALQSAKYLRKYRNEYNERNSKPSGADHDDQS